MKRISRILALILALVLCLSLAGCTTDITYITEYEGVKVYTGAYVCAMIRALNTAANYIPSDTKDPWSETIEGKTVEDWVTDQAHQAVRQYIVLNQIGDEMGVGLSETEYETAKNMAALLKQYYPYYESNNVADVELEQFCQMTLLYQVIFQEYYGEGKEKEIPAEDVLEYYMDNYMRFSILLFENYDKDGQEYTGTELTDYKELIKSYAETAAEDYTKMDELICRYKAYRTGVLYDTDTSNPLPTADDKIEVTDQTISVDRGNQVDYPEEVLDMIQALPLNKPTLLEYEGIDFLACNYGPDTDETTLTYYDLECRLGLKQGEFEEFLNERGNALKLNFNGAAARKYTPKTINAQ